MRRLNAHLIAVGTGTTDTIATSNDDGLTWTGRGKTAFTTTGYGVAYGFDTSGNEIIVSVGSGTNQIATSYDYGVTWGNLNSSTFTTSGLGIAYGLDASGNGLWVAGGQGTNSLAWSNDGITWNGLGLGIFSTSCYAVAYANGLWVAGGLGTNHFAWSDDGITWNGNGLIAGINRIRALAYGNGIWVASLQDTTNPYYSIAYSCDGKSWTVIETTFFSTSYSVSVAYYNGMFIATSNNRQWIMHSFDGINWANNSNLSFTNAYGIAHNGTHWVVNRNGFAEYSLDGYTWTTSAATPFTQGEGIASANILPLSE